MLARFSIDRPERFVCVRRTVQNTDVSRRSAFAKSETVELTLQISRVLGICLARLSLKNDKTGQVTEIPFELDTTEKGIDFNIDFTLSETAPEVPFRLLVYADGY